MCRLDLHLSDPDTVRYCGLHTCCTMCYVMLFLKCFEKQHTADFSSCLCCTVPCGDQDILSQSLSQTQCNEMMTDVVKSQQLHIISVLISGAVCLMLELCLRLTCCTAQHSTAQHSTAQHSTAILLSPCSMSSTHIITLAPLPASIWHDSH